MTNIKFIYFDVGGVLLLDYSGNNKWEEMKKGMGIEQNKSQDFERIWEAYNKRVCLDYDVDEIVPILEKELSLTLPSNYSLLEDFVSRFDLNHSIWPIVKSAEEKYGLGLLTNMYPRMLSLIQKSELIPNINWDVVIDSSIVGCQKPESQIYEISEQRAKTEGNEILFIENGIENIEAAKKRGWQTFLYDPQKPEESSQSLSKILELSS